MVFGNRGLDCATGVAFTRDPGSGERRIYGEYLINAQGEDVVAGIRTPRQILPTEGDDGLFAGAFEIPAGDYEGKVALDGSWTENYGVDGVPDGDNYPFSLAADGTVTFTYDPESNILVIVTE